MVGGVVLVVCGVKLFLRELDGELGFDLKTVEMCVSRNLAISSCEV